MYWLILAIALFSGHGFAQTFETLEDFSFAQDQANYGEKTSFFSKADSALVDGAITSFPPDRTTFDRTLVSILRVGYSYRFTPKFALRGILDSRYFIHKVHEEEEPRNVEEEEYLESRTSLDLAFTFGHGFQLFGGGQYWFFPEYTGVTESVTFDSEIDYGPVGMFVPRVGLMKTTSVFDGGVFYLKGVEKNRSVTKVASDGSEIDTEELVYSPNEVGLFVRVDIRGYITDIEFAAVQAGSGGPTAGESDAKTLEDYTRGRLGVFIPWEKNTLNFHARIVHKTLSYAGSDFVNVRTLPMTTLHLKALNGSFEKHFYYGIMYGYTEDTQSTDEFNQKYVVNVYGLKLGLSWLF